MLKSMKTWSAFTLPTANLSRDANYKANNERLKANKTTFNVWCIQSSREYPKGVDTWNAFASRLADKKEVRKLTYREL